MTVVGRGKGGEDHSILRRFLIPFHLFIPLLPVSSMQTRGVEGASCDNSAFRCSCFSWISREKSWVSQAMSTLLYKHEKKLRPRLMRRSTSGVVQGELLCHRLHLDCSTADLAVSPAPPASLELLHGSTKRRKILQPHDSVADHSKVCPIMLSHDHMRGGAKGGHEVWDKS